jgi:hypothetical protein
MNSEFFDRLKKIALKKSIPFCYSCYKEAHMGVCPNCGSDDLMRLLPGNSCEYGTDWIIKAIIEEALSPVDIESEFEECMRSCYPETTQVAWASFDTISILKAMDSIAWELAQSEWTSNEEADGQLISFDNGSTYFQRNEIENYLQKESD